MCSDCFVSAALKGKIAAHAAAFRKATASPFGANDEIGMLNLIDAVSRQAIMDRADPTKIYDLSVDNFVGMPGWFAAGDQPYQIWMTHTPGGEQVDDVMGVGTAGNELARIIHEKCAIKAKPLISFTTMRMGCLMKFFAMKSLAQVFGGLGRFRAVR